jgi:hypothetical protein
MKFCVIGNSHAAALRNGTKLSGALKAPYLDFWVIGGANQPAVVFEGGRIRPAPAKFQVRPISTVPDAAENGLDIAPYDAVIISACGLRAPRNRLISRDPSVHPHGHLACEGWLELKAEKVPAEVQPVSPQEFEAAVTSLLSSHPTMQLARLLAENFKGRVFLQPWPPPNETIFDDAEWFLVRRYGKNGSRLAWRDFLRVQFHALQKLARELGSRFEVIDYPMAEILEHGMMPPGYSVPDPWHANAKYGALVLEQIDARRERMLRCD